MLKNYFKIAWRTLLRNRLYTGINIGGLIIGFTIGIATLFTTYQQFTWDHGYVNRDRLYEVYQVFHDPAKDRYDPSFGFGPGPAYKAGAPAIERMTRMADGGAQIRYNGRVLQIPVTLVDSDFLSMFMPSVVKGRGADALHDLTDVVVTENTAKMIFGNEDAIGKHLSASAGDRDLDLVVSAVVKDPVNTSVRFGILARIENASDYARQSNEWNNRLLVMYVQLKMGAPARKAELQLKDIDHKNVPGWDTDLKEKGAKPDKYGDLWATHLLPLKDASFATDINGHRAKSIGEVMIAMSIGLFIVLIACFNFINISLAGAFTRSREVGVRKCLGAGRGKLFLQLWGESLVVCVVAFALSLVLVNVLLHSIPVFQKAQAAITDVMYRPVFLALMVGMLLLVSLMAGGYPALVMVRFRVVETLKGKLNMNGKSRLRSSLIVLQFVISCALISCTYIMYRQYQFLTHADVGIAKEELISVPLHTPDKGHTLIAQLRTRLAADPRIVSVSGANINLGRGVDHRTSHINTNFTYHGRDINTQFAMVDYDYLKTLGVKLRGGRDFAPGYGTDTVENVVINESMANLLQEKEIVGKTIITDSSNHRGWHIVGVFPDFHLYTLAEKVEPLTLTVNMKDAIPYAFIRTTGKDMLGAMESIKRTMAELEPGQQFNGTFVDDNINDWYTDERGMSIIFSVTAGIAILLSCSGLLAMVLLIVQQRVKEIGVRKVLGASVQSISLLVSREFIVLVALAVVIATPIAWIAMQQLMLHYPYRIGITIWDFLAVGLVAIGIAILTIAYNTIRAARQNPVHALRSE